MRILFLVVILLPSFSWANDFPVQVKLFAGATDSDPKDINDESATEGFEKFGTAAQLGLEATYPVIKYLELGLRFAYRDFAAKEVIPTANQDYKYQLTQTTGQGVVRIPFVKTSMFRFDAFAGIGGSNTTLKVKTPTQNGELSRKDSGDWFGALTSSYGASVAVGYKKVYFVVEGGFESNKIDSLKRTGTVNSNINEIDLSGTFVTIGLMFDGMASSK